MSTIGPVFKGTIRFIPQFESPYLCIRNHDYPATHTKCIICGVKIKECGYCHSGECDLCLRDKKIDICLA